MKNKQAKKLQKQFISAMQISEDEIKISFPNMFCFSSLRGGGKLFSRSPKHQILRKQHKHQ